ncbi:MAG: hypothetical protein IKC03_10315 [Oscillospiraceae bacterium]|nr:hypothetical protein [Oscillospiraceae bacterium]
MTKVIFTLCWLIAFGVVLYLQYRNGYIHTQAKRAVMYIGSVGDKNARFISCTGYTKRVVKFRESGTICFTFQPNVSAGAVTVELLNEQKQSILNLSDTRRIADIQVEAKKRYYLVIHFQSATGSYRLEWKDTEGRGV